MLESSTSVIVDTKNLDKLSCWVKVFGCVDIEAGLVHKMPPFRVHHNSLFHKFWDIMLICFLTYMSIVLPVTVGFSVSSNATTDIGTLIDVFFMVDLVINFFTTYEDDQKILILDFYTIGVNYLTGWFGIDLLSSVPLQWIPGLEDDSGSFEAFRGLKIIKLVKLLRVLRLTRLIALLQERFQIKHATVMIVEFMGIIFMVAHWLGCVFYFVTKLQWDNDQVWSMSYLADTPGGPLENRAVYEKYIAVLYWSLTTMSTIGFGDIVPKTTTERVFTTVSMILGACIFAYGLTNVCALVFNHNKHKARFEANTDELNEYIERRNLNQQLGTKLTRAMWYQHTSSSLEESPQVHEAMLGGFSPGLQRQAYLHLAKQTFCARQPPVIVKDVQMLSTLFRHARGQIYPPHEQVWETGRRYESRPISDKDQVYFLVKGAVSVMRNGIFVEELTVGSSFGEQSMFLNSNATTDDVDEADQVDEADDMVYKFYCKKHCDIYCVSRKSIQQMMVDDMEHLQYLIDVLRDREHDWISTSEAKYILEAKQRPLQTDNKIKSRSVSRNTSNSASRRGSEAGVVDADKSSKVVLGPLKNPDAAAFMKKPDSVISIQTEIIAAQEHLVELYKRLDRAKATKQHLKANKNSV